MTDTTFNLHGLVEFVKAARAKLASLLSWLVGSRHLPPLALGPNPASAQNQVSTHSANIAIHPEHEAELTALIAELRSEFGTFIHGTPGVHFARVSILSGKRFADVGDKLSIGIIFDGPIETAIDFVTSNADTLDPIFRHCEGYTADSARDPVKISRFLDRYSAKDGLFFSKYRTSASEIDACLSVQAHFLQFLRDVSNLPKEKVPEYLPSLMNRFLLASGDGDRSVDSARPRRYRDKIPFRPHLTNTLSMVQPIKPGRFDRKSYVPYSDSGMLKVLRFIGPLFTHQQLFKIIAAIGNFSTRQLHRHPLIDLHTLHFGRAAIVNGNMVFSSVYDGDFTQYVVDFSSRVADQIDLIWGLMEGYPAAGCRDVTGFLKWIRDGQVDVEDFYSATGNITLIQLQNAIELRKKLVRFSNRLPADGEELQSRLDSFVQENQALLG